jgi:hypothetical protein
MTKMWEEKKLDVSALFANARILDVLERREYQTKELKGTKITDFCPYCRERVKRGRLDPKKELKPLLRVTYKELCEFVEVETVDHEVIIKSRSGEGTVQYTTQYECQICKDEKHNRRVISEDDISEFYGNKKLEKKGVFDNSFFLSNENLAARGFSERQEHSLAMEVLGISSEEVPF